MQIMNRMNPNESANVTEFVEVRTTNNIFENKEDRSRSRN